MPYQIGATSGTLTDLDALTTPVPNPIAKEHFQEYSLYKTLGNGKRKGYGTPKTKWEFALLSQEEYDELAAFFPTGSDTVYITTRLPDDSYVSYEVTGNFPIQKPVFGGGYFNNIVIEFEFMEELP